MNNKLDIIHNIKNKNYIFKLVSDYKFYNIVIWEGETIDNKLKVSL